ncbi:hypothetical protein [Alkalibaculum bacchi]|uniref:hypothetical protein n=1 Tax=Alkalibaculum bacchi TaxID=645887 RepID=UPI0026EB3B7E|nr:hypothetical protein [Alkalibaculum bacchi]
MKVNPTNKVVVSSLYHKDDHTRIKENPKSVVETSSQESDAYIPSKETKSEGKTYQKDTATINKLKMESEKQTQQLRDIVEKLIMQQGEKFQDTGNLEIDSATREKALKEISENGYWGVEQTSERIFEFSKALSGGDLAKAQLMKDAFIKGFEQAKEAWGGTLPEISNKTYDATIKMFDQWIAENQQ